MCICVRATPPCFSDLSIHTMGSARIVAESRTLRTICTHGCPRLHRRRLVHCQRIRIRTASVLLRDSRARSCGPDHGLVPCGVRAVNDEPTAALRESPRARVRRLASLGGLVALAGLDRIAPDLLLGILLEVAERFALLSARRTQELAQRGGSRLRQRHAEKRTWTVHPRAEGTHRVELSTRELHVLLQALGIAPEGDLGELVCLLRAALARTANAAADRG